MKAIIPAAWYGTRMLPITKTIPKEMLPIWDKPVIQYIVEWLVAWWIEEIWFVTSQWKSALEWYFDKNYELEDILVKKWKNDLLDEINKPKNLANYVFFKQKEQLWFPHALWETRNWITDDFFFVSVGDQFWDKKLYTEIIKKHNETKQPIIWVQKVPKEKLSSYWIVAINKQWAIDDIIEKPETPQQAPSEFACNGLYILPKEFFEIVSNTPMQQDKGEIVMPDCLLQLTDKWDLIPFDCWERVWDVWNTELRHQANVETKKLWYW